MYLPDVEIFVSIVVVPVSGSDLATIAVSPPEKVTVSPSSRAPDVTVYFKNDTTKKVVVSGRGNWGLKPDEIKLQDPIGDISLNSDDTVTKYNLVIETHKEAGYK